MFSTACHPQTNSQTEVVNWTLSTLLCTVVNKNLKNWDECLAFVEFTYNLSGHYTIKQSPFEVVYGFNPTTPLDLVPIPVNDKGIVDGAKKAKWVRAMHRNIKEHIEKKNEAYGRAANKGKKQV